VHSTDNEVITFGGQLVDPVYHSSCGGAGTINAGEVWKFDLPYLKGVDCPYDADPEPLRVVTYTAAEFKKATGEDISSLPVSVGPRGLFETIETTSNGWPKTVRIGSRLFSSTAAREMLGLRSARFKIYSEGGGVKVSTLGYGHGVGMCQYGAKGMALKGIKYQEILKHYYTGADINDLL